MNSHRYVHLTMQYGNGVLHPLYEAASYCTCHHAALPANVL